MGMGIQVFEGELLQSAESSLANVLNHIVYNSVITDIHDPLAQSRKQNDNAHFLQNREQGGPGTVHIQGGRVGNVDQPVHSPSSQNGKIKRKYNGYDCHQNGQRHQETVRFNVFQHLQKGFFLF